MPYARPEEPLGEVRVHTDASADWLSQAVGADAVTFGRHIYFAAGRYQPETRAGCALLDHEVAHALAPQQGVLQCYPDPPPAPAPANVADWRVAAQHADELYRALDWWNNEPRAIAALVGQSEPMRAQLARQFQARHGGVRIQDYLKDQLGGVWLVWAFALLSAENLDGFHTRMAVAIIPAQTADDEVFRILYGLRLPDRRAMEAHYDAAFHEIGQHSLRRDLVDDLSGWRVQKSLALLDRDLTSADDLYFDSVGICLANSPQVVQRIQREGARGPDSFALFLRDWDTKVVPQYRVEYPSMRAAMRSELYGESLSLVEAVFTGYEDYRAHAARYEATANSPGNPEMALVNRETAQLLTAELTLTAATVGGFTGWGTNTDQVVSAVQTIRRIHLGRIARAEAGLPPETVALYRRQWDERRRRLPGESEMDEGTGGYQRIRLLATAAPAPTTAPAVAPAASATADSVPGANLADADEIYVAWMDRDEDRVVSLVTGAWARGRMDALLADAARPRREGGVEVRHSFEVAEMVGVNSGVTRQRVGATSRRDLDDPGRGSLRMRVELTQGSADDVLGRIHTLLTTQGISAALRTETIGRFSSSLSADTPAGPPAERVLFYFGERFRETVTLYRLRDLLLPTTDPQTMLSRAESRFLAAHSGIFDSGIRTLAQTRNPAAAYASPDLVNQVSLTGIYDTLTGEDSAALELQNLYRLRRLVANAQATPAQAAAMVGLTQPRPMATVIDTENRTLTERIDEGIALRQSVVNALVSVAEIAVEAVVSIATGGAALPALFSSLATAVAGMAARELALEGNLDRLLSDENVARLVTIVVTHGAASAAQAGARALVAPNLERAQEAFAAAQITRQQLQQVAQRAAAIEGAVGEAFGQIGAQTVQAAFDGRAPHERELAAGAIAILGHSTAAGMRNAIASRIAEDAPFIARVRTQVVAHVAQQFLGALTDESAATTREGLEHLSAGQITGRLVRRFGEGLGRGVTQGIAAAGAHVVAERNAQRRGLGRLEDPEREAHDPSRLPPRGDRPRRPARMGEHHVLFVMPVPGESAHAITALRGRDGRIFFKICSPTCGVLLRLIRAAMETREPGEEDAAHEPGAALRGLADEVESLERALAEENGEQRVFATTRLEAVAAEVGEAIQRLGDPRFFGVAEAPGAATSPSAGGRAAAIRANDLQSLPAPFRDAVGMPDRGGRPDDRTRRFIQENGGLPLIRQVLQAWTGAPEALPQYIEALGAGALLDLLRTIRPAERVAAVEQYMTGTAPAGALRFPGNVSAERLQEVRGRISRLEGQTRSPSQEQELADLRHEVARHYERRAGESDDALVDRLYARAANETLDQYRARLRTLEDEALDVAAPAGDETPVRLLTRASEQARRESTLVGELEATHEHIEELLTQARRELSELDARREQLRRLENDLLLIDSAESTALETRRIAQRDIDRNNEASRARLGPTIDDANERIRAGEEERRRLLGGRTREQVQRDLVRLERESNDAAARVRRLGRATGTVRAAVVARQEASGDVWPHYEYGMLGSILPCFPAGTPVKTPSGDRNIEDLAGGDLVYAFDCSSRELRPCPIVRTHRNQTLHLVTIELDGEIVRCTREHRFWDARAQDWRPARQLMTGDRVLALDGAERTVRAVSVRPEAATTYNLEVAELHTYFVGETGILVHNGGPNTGSGTSGYAGQRRDLIRIYEVEVLRPNGQWQVIYVGQTEQGGDGNVQVRFSDHLDLKPAWARLEEAGRLRCRMIRGAQGYWTYYEAAVWENHYIRAARRRNPALENVTHMEPAAFAQYHDLHNPCRCR